MRRETIMGYDKNPNWRKQSKFQFALGASMKRGWHLVSLLTFGSKELRSLADEVVRMWTETASSQRQPSLQSDSTSARAVTAY